MKMTCPIFQREKADLGQIGERATLEARQLPESRVCKGIDLPVTQRPRMVEDLRNPLAPEPIRFLKRVVGLVDD